MAFNDLREFINKLEEKNWLKRISQPVDCELEITEIADRVSKMKNEKNIALLFENVRGYNVPVLINAFGSMERMALALGVGKIDEIAQEINEIFKSLYMSPPNKIDLLKIMPEDKQIVYLPKYLKNAPCKEVILKDQPFLGKFPILKSWPGDGGPFITLPLVFTKNPKDGRRNIGMYRLQVYDGQTTGMHWHLHRTGADNYRAHRELGKDRMEVAVAIGTDPAVTYAATVPLPQEIDELVFAGFLRKKPVEIVKCETVDIEVPATSEIVLEGYINLDELRQEGPCGNHTGYYSRIDEYPVFHITCVTHRQNPIYAATIVGKPPMENCYMFKATERIFLPAIKMQLPEIADINLPLEGIFHNCAIIAIKKTYPGQAKKIMQAIWDMKQLALTKMIIVVDANVNVANMDEVWWRVFNNIDARRDIIMVDGPIDALDHSSPILRWGTKVGIDATKAWPEEGQARPWPDEIMMSQEIKNIVDEKWQYLGLN